MATGPRYKVPFRRRRSAKTNYYKRLHLILSKKPRLVVRKSNKHIRTQLVIPEAIGDKVLGSAFSKELAGYGYAGSTSNTPAAYLTGLLLGLRIKQKGYTEAILDLGLHSNTGGSKMYAALKGVLDAGIQVPHDDSVIPDEERIRGEHIDSDLSVQFGAIKEKIQQNFR